MSGGGGSSWPQPSYNERNFAKLLCEIEAAVDISEQDWDLICASMDMDREVLANNMNEARHVSAKAREG